MRTKAIHPEGFTTKITSILEKIRQITLSGPMSFLCVQNTHLFHSNSTIHTSQLFFLHPFCNKLFLRWRAQIRLGPTLPPTFSGVCLGNLWKITLLALAALNLAKKCSFTACKLRFFRQIRLARASPPTFFRASLNRTICRKHPALRKNNLEDFSCSTNKKGA